MLCPKCGKEIEDGLYKCPFCDEKVFVKKKARWDEDEPRVIENNLKDESRADSETTHTYKKTAIMLGAFAIGLLAFIIIGVLFF